MTELYYQSDLDMNLFRAMMMPRHTIASFFKQ